MITIKVSGLSELRERMGRFPEKLDEGMEQAMKVTLLLVHGAMPGYPPAPMGSTYRRTGTLGRTLGSSATGGASSQPEIYTVEKMGHGWEGRFGTRLKYAPYVIGDEQQAKVHQGRWWVLSDVATRAQGKIQRNWELLAKYMAKFLEGK